MFGSYSVINVIVLLNLLIAMVSKHSRIKNVFCCDLISRTRIILLADVELVRYD